MVAAEKVDLGPGQISDILYVGCQSCVGGNGTLSTLLYLGDGDGIPPSDGEHGNFLFRFDFNPNNGSVTVTMHQRIGGTWVVVPTPVGSVEGTASPGGDFGEVALNLTALGILPEDECRTIEVTGQGATVTGGSLNSQPKDLIEIEPVTISNCGGLDVTKLANPPVASTDLFRYVVDQSDGAEVHAPDLTGPGAPATTEPDANATEIDANISAGETHNWRNLISQPDYEIEESLPLPDGWALETIECTYIDIFLDPPSEVTTIVYENGVYTGNTFLVPPEFFAGAAVDPASCTITNSTSAVIIEKIGTGDPIADFPFALTDPAGGGGTISTQIGGADAPLALGETADSVAYAPGTTVTVTETLPVSTPGWTHTSTSCSYVDDNGIEVVVSTDLCRQYDCSRWHRIRVCCRLCRSGLS